MRYNTMFKMQDFFMNDRLSAVFPQLDKEDMTQDLISDDRINTKMQKYFCDALGGTMVGEDICLEGNPNDVTKKLNSLKFIAEGFFDNIKSIMQNARNNSTLYTTVANLTQLTELTSELHKLKFFNEVQDNLNYNPDFNCQNTVESYSPLPYALRQQMWEKKVGYRRK